MPWHLERPGHLVMPQLLLLRSHCRPPRSQGRAALRDTASPGACQSVHRMLTDAAPALNLPTKLRCLRSITP